MPRVSRSTLGFSSLIIVTAINILFGTFKLINLLQIEFYYFYSPRTIDIAIFSPIIDLWIWAASLLLITSTVFLKRKLSHLNLPRWTILLNLLSLASLTLFLFDNQLASTLAVPLGFLTVISSAFLADDLFLEKERAALLISASVITMLIPIELLSLSSWTVNAFNYEAPFTTGLRWTFPSIDLQLFNVVYPLIPFLFFIFLYSWIWIPASRHILSRVRKSKNHPSIQAASTSDSKTLTRRCLALGLVLSLALSVFIAYYPYIHLPSSTLVGIDSIPYYDNLNVLMQKGPYAALQSDKPLFNMLMYTLKYATPLSVKDVVRITPIIATLCLSLAVFWFVKVGTKNERLALLSSVFSAISFQATVSMFAYSIANWLALAETFLLMALLLKSQQQYSIKYAVLSVLVGIAVLLTHPYTWDIMIVILISYFAWAVIRKSQRKLETTPLTILLAANLLFYIVYNLTPLGKGVASGEGTYLQSIASNISISNLLQLGNTLTSMVQTWAGGLFANPPLVILAIVGMLSITSNSKFNRMMLLWVAVPSLVLLTISPAQDAFYYRLVYLVPFQILAALGLQSILNKLKDTEQKFKLNSAYSRLLNLLLVSLVMLFLLNYSLRSVDEALPRALIPQP
jgi:hypothetical protein